MLLFSFIFKQNYSKRELYLQGPPETVTIQLKNFPDYRFGIHSEESLTELYIVNDHIISFTEIRPGLTGDPETVSFQSKEDGKYMANENTYLGLQEFEDGPGFANSATFKIYPDKFFGVSISCVEKSVFE